MKFLLGSFICIFSFTVYGQSWNDAEDLPAAASVRHHPVTFSIGGVGYLVTGAKPGAGVLDDFYSYDPIADDWTTLPNFPGGARGFAYGVSTDTKGYVGFGVFENEVTFEIAVFNDLWEYDPVTEDWTELASCPCVERFHPAMIQVDDKIYVGLGANEFGDLGDWWEYDISTDTWSEKTPFPGTERHHPYYFGIDGFAYVGFGHHASDIYNDFYRYDPATDTWLELSEFPDQGRVAGTQFSHEGKGYILSGQGETHNNLPTGEFWQYTPETDSWEELTAHGGGGRWAPGSFVINDQAFFTCGESNIGERKDLLVFDLGPLVGIEENAALENVQLNPNPSTGKVFIQNGNFNSAQIFDMGGRLVHDIPLTSNEIDLTHLDGGIYVVQLHGNDKTISRKLILE